MKIATQQEVDTFNAKYLSDSEIFPYLTTSKTFSTFTTVELNDWNGLTFVDSHLECLLKIRFDRARDVEFAVSLYTKNPFKAGKALLLIKDLIERYKPRAINTVVHSSNTKSIKLHNKLFGAPWGVERLGAWNMQKGEYEDLFYYRKLLHE